MIHVIDQDWAIDEISSAYIDCRKLFDLIKFRGISSVFVDIENIGYKSLDSISESDGRYQLANIQYPCIVTENVQNPMNKQYRLIDGRHRLMKQMRAGVNKVKCYVLDKDDLMKFITIK
jgi:hypothetical protein